MNRKPLTKQEKAIIEDKFTEPSFSGKYYDHFKQGNYHCKRCGQALFTSQAKFNAGCGWPSFDDTIEGAVDRQLDIDGRRTEIICSNCGAHLGHVFTGEDFTDKNIRHCVNSLSLIFKGKTND